jgi:hypothetical protein
VTAAWSWIAIAALGAYHGLDPSMGWLFAVALGLQERSRAKVIGALFPIAAGHLASVGIVVALLAFALARVSAMMRPLGAAILIGFGIFRLIRPRAHPRWVAMRVGALDLMAWSFLMATAHGAGLMLFPILLGMNQQGAPAMPMHHHWMPMPHQMQPAITSGTPGVVEAAAVVIVHTGAMLIVMGTTAIVIFEWVGLKILRSAWINLDLVWAIALILAGLLSLVI